MAARRTRYARCVQSLASSKGLTDRQGSIVVRAGPVGVNMGAYSALLLLRSLGDTSVVCAVYGPKEARLKDERHDRAVLEVSWTPAKGSSGEDHRLARGRRLNRLSCQAPRNGMRKHSLPIHFYRRFFLKRFLERH